MSDVTRPLSSEECADLDRLLLKLAVLVGHPIVAGSVDLFWIPLRPLGVECHGYRFNRNNLRAAARPGAPVAHIVIDMRHALGWGPPLRFIEQTGPTTTPAAPPPVGDQQHG